MQRADATELYREYLATREGKVAHVIGALLSIGALANAFGPKGHPGSLVVVLPITWLVSWGIARLLRRAWERRTWPVTPTYARRSAPNSGRPTLREDHNASLWTDRSGFLWQRRAWFSATGCPPTSVGVLTFNRIMNEEDGELPVYVAENLPRRWWMWHGTFYWDTGSYTAADIKALLFKRQLRTERELEHAHTLMAAHDGSGQPRKRELIPEDVKRAVFRRDEGLCQACGGNELLQFDHIIPFSMGGSNEPENLQLLCAACNREKGGTL